jgi:thiosulfate/3-mercaptopyruvate sulfurtransferase
MSENVVSTAWLAERLSAPDIVVIDASWHLPAAKRDPKAEFLAKHIPGARFYDIDAGSEPNTTLPHMLPSPEKFARDVKALGVGDGKTVIVYDAAGLFSAARLWWMLKVFGHRDCAVLDGGFPKWETEGRPLENGEPAKAAERHFTPRRNATMVKSLADVRNAIASGSAQIADARAPGRFRGEAPEPRPGVRSGHMPGAKNVHYLTLLNEDGTLKSVDDLRAVFSAAGVKLEKPVITSCGSGVNAAILSLALSQIGAPNHSLYDGSWTEWGSSTEAVEAG